MQKIILFILILYRATSLAAPTPVLLFLSERDQADSLGYNIVKELPPLVYNEIMSGRLSLWDSPKKEVQIKPSTLRKLEESSGMEFSKAAQLFIYEMWDIARKDGELNTIGFYFSNRTANGEEISYGYVDADPLDHLFRHTPIPTNANGNCYTSFESILTNKYYFYNIVQYGEKQISNLKEAIELKEEVRKFLDIKTNPPVFDCKVLWYTIDGLGKEENPGTKASQSFLAALQSFLNENREVFYNLGGDKIRNFMQPGKILVNRMEVRERWKKQDNQIVYEFEMARIYVDDKPLDSLSATDFKKLDFLVDFKSPADFLNEKEFYFRIFKINSQEIDSAKSDAFLNGLKTWKWNVLTEFAKYE